MGIFISFSITNKCNEDDQAALLRLKQSLTFDSSASSKLVTWNSSTDCCSWVGETCSKSGYAVGIDISGESVVLGIRNFSRSSTP
ncbi:unnamed protein product [Prunus brigantina]